MNLNCDTWESIDEPINVIDFGMARVQKNKWDILFPKVQPYFAVKCLDHPEMIKILADNGTNFDCASEMEIKNVKDAVPGIDGDRIVFSHTCKTPSSIQYACDNGVTLFAADCVEEVQKIIDSFKPSVPNNNNNNNNGCHAIRKPQILIRVIVEDSDSKLNLNEKFGCTWDVCYEIINMIHYNTDKVSLAGFAFHAGGGGASPHLITRTIQRCYETLLYSRKLFRTSECRIIDIGGSFTNSISMIKSAEVIMECIDSINERNASNGQEPVVFISEPGTWFGTPCVSTFTKVLLATKREKTNSYTLNQGSFGMLACSRFIMWIPNIDIIPVNGAKDKDRKLDKKVYCCNSNTRTIEIPESNKTMSTLWGPTCSSSDFIVKNINVPIEMRYGDMVAFIGCGPYSYMICKTFNGIPTGVNLVIKQYESCNDVIYGDNHDRTRYEISTGDDDIKNGRYEKYKTLFDNIIDIYEDRKRYHEEPWREYCSKW